MLRLRCTPLIGVPVARLQATCLSPAGPASFRRIAPPAPGVLRPVRDRHLHVRVPGQSLRGAHGADSWPPSLPSRMPLRDASGAPYPIVAVT